MQTLIFRLAAIAVPILSIFFVAALLSHKLYINLRSRYNIKVNCWFCNDNTHVPFPERNSWTCPLCEQYNGFNADGDYNREILAQRDCSGRQSNPNLSKRTEASCATELAGMNNGLCDQCNEAQRLKIEKLAQFEPKSAALLKQPYFEKLARVQQQRRIARYQLWMTLLTWLNVVCLLSSLPVATRDQFNSLLGISLAHPLYFIYSHALTLLRVLIDFIGNLLTEPVYMAKLSLYVSTFGKLVLYSLGIGQHATFSSCYISLYPYAMWALSFICNISDGFRFTRFTLLLVLWSVHAKHSLLLFDAIDSVTFLLLASVLTLFLLLSNRKRSNWLDYGGAHNESAADSFHRLCADECISDDETISMLSQQLSYNASNNSSTLSTMIPSTNDARRNNNNLNQLNNLISNSQLPPSVLSLDSLRLSSQRSPVSRMGPLPAPSLAHTCRSQSPLYAASSNYAMHMDPLQLGQPQGWQQRNCAPQTNFRLDQRPMTRSTSSLLFPSRLQMQQQQQQQQLNREICAWVDATSGSQHGDLLREPTTANLMGCYNRDLSPNSSLSSGFESQPGNNQFWGPPAAATLQQQQLSNGTINDSIWPETTTQRQLRVPAPLHSPYSTHSEMHFGRTTAGPQSQSDLRPGDLLRKWMNRNGIDTQKR
ncbi:GH21320 [Drosophila grimshawi]|uniref:GH21320 n=1 Tax=Drosophila grimshawi TaxID=7222 RepID=B4J893_DROGR|nr:GH21320 [Drosophila grimshawi]